MKVEQVKNCIFSEWYQTFSAVTVKSVAIPLPQDVVRYLLADGIVLPEGSDHGCCNNNKNCHSDSDDDEINWDNNATSGRTALVPKFSPEFENRVESALKKLGGAVFPKLNWSAPKDAAWVATGNTLQCRSLGDILLLLKSSDFVAHDLTVPFERCTDIGEDLNDDRTAARYELVLRKWTTIAQSSEFRCFVKNGKIIAISQRYFAVYFPFLLADKTRIVDDIVKFHRAAIGGRFRDDAYAMDVYRRDDGSVRLLDFNPFGETTDSLLFDWTELRESDADSEPEFRCVERESGVQPNEFHPYAVPKDFVDLSRGEDPFKLMDLMKLREASAEASDSSSDEEE
ncbi:translation initiation factor eIF2 assembly protein-like [Tubulanus polymorphus]|uniref:translation initiation factor eIF2 assembly protein-like n=1 Tax=Tubulanus polymorphus TaxID=672921 RepID=UPI003DA36637